MSVVAERELTPVDQFEFRRAMSLFSTGVVVVTSVGDDGPIGMTCQSFVSLSLDPALIAVCPGASSQTWPAIAARGHFLVNVLAASQRAVSASFARSGTDKFAGHPWYIGDHGLPVLAESIAHVECRMRASHSAGDHEVVIASVLSLGIPVGDAPEPLIYYRSAYRGLSAEPE